MRIIKRIGTSFSAYMEQLAASIENPEEVLKAAIREIDANLAKAEYRLRRVIAEKRDLDIRVEELHNSIATWLMRAKRESEENKDRALECLKRKKQEERKLARLLESHKSQESMEEMLKSDIETVSLRRDELKAKLNLLVARDARARAINTCDRIVIGNKSGLDDVIERWEINIAVNEGSSFNSPNQSLDYLKEEYETLEEREQLEQELKKLSGL
jgi:phage shock protein A